jgi:hypothetical protein
MDPHGFDRLARLLARLPASPSAAQTPRSRRQVLRGIAVGMVSTAAFARTPERVAAALCPNRVPVPGYRPTVNGCGPSGFGWTIPDSWGRANFTPACNQHDRCYGTCNSNRRVCDNQMRRQMKRECNRVYSNKDGQENFWRLKCLRRANLYYNVVNRRGQSAYEDAQNEACFCCDPGQIACRTGCCSPQFCQACIGDTCQWTCGPCQWCNRGVCQDCGVGCCGG